MSKTLNTDVPHQTEVYVGQPTLIYEKTLSNAIMRRTRFHNKYRQNKTDGNRRKYTNQRNYCVSLLRKLYKIMMAQQVF